MRSLVLLKPGQFSLFSVLYKNVEAHFPALNSGKEKPHRFFNFTNSKDMKHCETGILPIVMALRQKMFCFLWATNC